MYVVICNDTSSIIDKTFLNSEGGVLFFVCNENFLVTHFV